MADAASYTLADSCEFDPFAVGGWQDNDATATTDDPWVAEILSPDEVKLARIVAHTYPEYAWAKQCLRNFSPEEREELRAAREQFLSKPEVQRILGAQAAHQAECEVAARS